MKKCVICDKIKVQNGVCSDCEQQLRMEKEFTEKVSDLTIDYLYHKGCSIHSVIGSLELVKLIITHDYNIQDDESRETK